jgi:hypothetical protein
MKHINVKQFFPTLDTWELYDEFVGEDHVFSFSLGHIWETVRFSTMVLIDKLAETF